MRSSTYTPKKNDEEDGDESYPTSRTYDDLDDSNRFEEQQQTSARVLFEDEVLKKSTTQPAQQQPPIQQQSPEAQQIQIMTRDLNDVLRRASEPMISLLGSVAVKLRLDNMYTLLVWDEKKSPLEKRPEVARTADSLEDWVRVNRDFGPALLEMMLSTIPEQKPPELIRACFDIGDIEDNGDLDNNLRGAKQKYPHIFGDAERARALLRAEEYQNENIFAPALVYQLMGDAVFRRWIAADALAAVEMAHSHIQRIPNCSSFTLKELVCSSAIRDHFAFMVAYQYLMVGDNPSRKDGRGNSRGTTYLNVLKMRQSLSDRVFTANTFFEMCVRARPNPLLELFDKKRIALRARKHRSPEWENKMKIYRAMLPQRELYYTAA